MRVLDLDFYAVRYLASDEIRVRARVARFFLAQYTKAGENIQNYQLPIKYTQWLHNIPNEQNVKQHYPFQGPSKYTRIGIFGLNRKEPIWQPWFALDFSVLTEGSNAMILDFHFCSQLTNKWTIGVKNSPIM
jgi:hypothetical protein